MISTPPAALRAALTQQEAAKFLGVTSRTLRNWRSAGFGPQPIRDGVAMLYDRAAIEAFAEGAR